MGIDYYKLIIPESYDFANKIQDIDKGLLLAVNHAQIDVRTSVIPAVVTPLSCSVSIEAVGLPQTSIAALHTDDLPLQFSGNDFEILA